MWCPVDTSLNWGICFIDPRESEPVTSALGHLQRGREFAREMGDPLRAVVETCSKLAAESDASRLRFGDALAHPATLEQATKASGFPHRPYRRHESQHSAGGNRV
jgi:hypothetical protein